MPQPFQPLYVEIAFSSRGRIEKIQVAHGSAEGALAVNTPMISLLGPRAQART